MIRIQLTIHTEPDLLSNLSLVSVEEYIDPWNGGVRVKPTKVGEYGELTTTCTSRYDSCCFTK